MAFGKLLRKDLEVCAELSLVGDPQQLLGRLHETEYTQVRFRLIQRNYITMMNISGCNSSIIPALDICTKGYFLK